MSLIPLEIVLKKKFAIICYETIPYAFAKKESNPQLSICFAGMKNDAFGYNGVPTELANY